MDMSFLYGAAGGGTVGAILTVAGIIAGFYGKRLIKERDTLFEQRLNDMASDHRELRVKFESHIKEDKGALILNELKNISSKQMEQSSALAAMREEVKTILVSDGRQAEKISSLERYVQGVDNALFEHKNNHPGGKK